jgi:hypothetical protein
MPEILPEDAVETMHNFMKQFGEGGFRGFGRYGRGRGRRGHHNRHFNNAYTGEGHHLPPHLYRGSSGSSSSDEEDVHPGENRGICRKKSHHSKKHYLDPKDYKEEISKFSLCYII